MFLNATLFAQITVFILFALFTMKYVWPPIVKALDERAAKISEGLAAAERGRQSLDLAAKRSADTLREGKDKAAEIIADAERRVRREVAARAGTVFVEGATHRAADLAFERGEIKAISCQDAFDSLEKRS